MLPNRNSLAERTQLFHAIDARRDGCHTRSLALAVLLIAAATPSYGALVADFDFRDITGATPGVQDVTDDSIWEFRIENLTENGVTFDAVVTVDGLNTIPWGADSTVTRTAQGLDTGTTAGIQTAYDNLTLSIDVEDVVGGNVSSAAFLSAVLNTDGMGGIIGGDHTAQFFNGSSPLFSLGLSPSDIATVVTFNPGSPPPSFRLTGTGGLFSTDIPGFFLQGVSLQFTTVPEPASLAMMGLAGIAFGGIGYRRRHGRNRSASSPVDRTLVG